MLSTMEGERLRRLGRLPHEGAVEFVHHFITWAVETTRTGGRSFGSTEAATRWRASRRFFSSSRNVAASRSFDRGSRWTP